MSINSHGRCGLRAIIHQLLKMGLHVSFGEFGEFEADPDIDYRTDDSKATLKFLGAAFRAYAKANLEYVKSLTGDEQVVPVEDIRDDDGEIVETVTLLQQAERLVDMYETAHANENLYKEAISTSLWATESILIGASMLHGVKIRVRHDRQTLVPTVDGMLVMKLDDSPNAIRQHNTTRDIDISGGSTEIIWLNNVILDGVGHHFDLQYWQNEHNPDFSDGTERGK